MQEQQGLQMLKVRQCQVQVMTERVQMVQQQKIQVERQWHQQQSQRQPQLLVQNHQDQERLTVPALQQGLRQQRAAHHSRLLLLLLTLCLMKTLQHCSRLFHQGV